MSPKAPLAAVGILRKKESRGEFTWQEVAKHNSAESAWVIVRGRVYDVTGFLDKHPGGREMLLLAAGRECTDLFEMYHALVDKPEKYLASYDIGAAVGPPEFTPFPEDTTGFWDTLKSRVKAHFKNTGQNPKSAVGGILRILPVFALLIAAFLVMNRVLLPDASFVVRVFAAIVFGISQVRACETGVECHACSSAHLALTLATTPGPSIAARHARRVAHVHRRV